MPEIIIIDLNNVTVDGEPVGSIFDLAWNRPQIEGVQSLALNTLQSWVDSRDQAHAAELADKQSLIDALGGTELGQEMARQAAISKAQAELAEAQAKLAALGGGE